MNKVPTEYELHLSHLYNTIEEFKDIDVEDDHPIMVMIDNWINYLKNGSIST